MEGEDDANTEEDVGEEYANTDGVVSTCLIICV